MRDVAPAQAEHNPTVHKKLATLSLHSGPVNCVRWALRTHRLASASDDKCAPPPPHRAFAPRPVAPHATPVVTVFPQARVPARVTDYRTYTPGEGTN